MAIPSTTIPTIPPMLADKLRLFEKHGLKPNFIITETGSAATTALLSGSISIIVGGPGEHVAAAARGQELVALVNLCKGSPPRSLSKSAAERAGVKSDAPVAERWKALDNMVIASSSATSPYRSRSVRQGPGGTSASPYAADQHGSGHRNRSGGRLHGQCPGLDDSGRQRKGRILGQRTHGRFPVSIRARRLHQYPVCQPQPAHPKLVASSAP